MNEGERPLPEDVVRKLQDRASLLLDLDRLPLAQKEIERALALDVTDPWSHYLMSRVLALRSRYEVHTWEDAIALRERAVGAAREAIALAPAQAAFHNQLAHVRSQQGLYELALASYRRCVELRPEEPSYKVDLAFPLANLAMREERLTREPQLDEVRTLAREAAAQGAGSNWVMCELARIYAFIEDPMSAEPCARAAVALEPERVWSLSVLGEVLRDLGRAEEALAIAVEVRRRVPANHIARIEVVEALTDLGRFDEAEATLDAFSRDERLGITRVRDCGGYVSGARGRAAANAAWQPIAAEREPTACAHERLRYRKSSSLLRQYVCAACGAVLHCACERDLAALLDDGCFGHVSPWIRNWIVAPAGFRDGACSRCRGGLPEPDRATEQSGTYAWYWREIWGDALRELGRQREALRAHGNDLPLHRAKRMFARFQEDGIAEAKRRHVRDPLYPYRPQGAPK